MRVHQTDWIPPSLLARRPSDAKRLVGGAAVTFGAHVILPACFGLFAAIATVISGGPEDEQELAVLEDTVVAATFVQLGREFDPNELPNRKVNRLATAPSDDLVVSKNPRKRRPEDEKRQPQASEDLIKRLGDRAQLFAEEAEKREMEGAADGIEDGTEKKRTGNEYLGQLYRIIRRGWTLPTTISDAERKDLKATVLIDISQTMVIQNVRVVGSGSGNALFDQSILDRVEALKRAGDPLPDPPIEVEDSYRGAAIRVIFRGRQAR